MKKYLQTHIKNILLIILVAIVWLLIVYAFVKAYNHNDNKKTYKEQAIERINLDSLKQKMYEEIKDSVHTADSLYKHKLSLMSNKERQQEFNRLFPK